MPVNYRIDGNVVTIQPLGAYSPNDVRGAWLAAEADPAYPRPASELRICVDARDGESLAKKSVAQMRVNVDWFSQRASASGRMCAFVARPGLQYGLLRMMAAWIEYNGYRAFVTTDPLEAVHWLRDQKADGLSGAA